MTLRRAVHAPEARFRLHRQLAKGCTPTSSCPDPESRSSLTVASGTAARTRPEDAVTGPNAQLWQDKMVRNRMRDERSSSLASSLGWGVERGGSAKSARTRRAWRRGCSQLTGATEPTRDSPPPGVPEVQCVLGRPRCPGRLLALRHDMDRPRLDRGIKSRFIFNEEGLQQSRSEPQLDFRTYVGGVVRAFATLPCCARNSSAMS